MSSQASSAIEFGGASAESAGPLVLPGIHDEVVAVLTAAGYSTIDKVIEAGAEALSSLQGFDAETVEAVLATAESERAARQPEVTADTEAASPESPETPATEPQPESETN